MKLIARTYFCAALLLSACGSSPQSLILGKWEAASAKVGGSDVGGVPKLAAEFNRDGTATITILGQMLQGTYKLNGENELEWTVNGITSKSKVKVTATELEVTDDTKTVRYKRK